MNGRRLRSYVAIASDRLTKYNSKVILPPFLRYLDP